MEMMIMKKIFPVFAMKSVLLPIIMIILFISSSLAKKIPDWVREKPVSDKYYIGIGEAPKTDKDYRNISKNNALSDLASEIMVNISSEFIHKLTEKSGMVEEDVRKQVRSSTKANIEGYELVEVWDDGESYWSYYRLSKARYAANKRAKIDKASGLSLDMLKKGDAAEKAGKISSALVYYIQSLNPLNDVIGEPLEVDYNGRRVFLFNEIYSSIQNLLSNIELKALTPAIDATVGQPLKNSLDVKAVYLSMNKPITGLKLNYEFTRGSGDLQNSATTNSDGIAKARLAKITSTDKIQMIKVQPDFSGYLNNSVSPIITNSLRKLSLPETKFILKVSGMAVYLIVEETHLNNSEPGILYVEPKVKNILAEQGFSFVKDMSKAAIVMELKAAARKGSEYHGMFTSYVDLNISVLDMNSGTEIYKNSITDIKGIQLDYDKAAVKAFEEAAKKVNEILPGVIKKIQQ
jgi:hypothetical protein